MRLSVFSALLGTAGLAAIQGMYVGGHGDPGYYPTHAPEYMSWKDLRNSVASETAKPIAKRGKIHVRGSQLFVNEPNKGIHVFDNVDPAAPRPIAFLKIPGNVDLAIRGGTLFADSFVDLVAIDISALPAIKVVNRQVDVFPYDPHQSADDAVHYNPAEIDRSKGVVVGWKKVEPK